MHACRSTLEDPTEFNPDYLVVALGAETRPDLVPGLAEHGHNVWRAADVPAAAAALERLEGGRILVLIAGAPYKCPPAPYECSMLIDEYLRDRGRRARVGIEIRTVQPLLMPNAGRAGSDWIGARLSSRDIGFATGKRVVRVEAGQVVFEDGPEPFDLLIGVPPHRPPALVADAGLTGEAGWVGVDPGTLETRFAGVFAIGDVTLIPLANGLPLPKAGIIAELEGARVARGIAARVLGHNEPPGFDGRGFCFIEGGKGSASTVEGDFFAQPEPVVTITEPSAAGAERKRAFEAERLARWFGS